MDTKISEMIGKIPAKVYTSKGDEMVFEMNDGSVYKFYHSQECCESVTIEDIDGDLDCLCGSPLLMAEEISGEPPKNNKVYVPDSVTWTFYKFATVKGYVTVRWYGTSNGYYSEAVDFARIKAPSSESIEGKEG